MSELWRPARVLVTGAAGMVGMAVLQRLSAEDIPATALILDSEAVPVADRVVAGDAGDPDTVREALSGVDAVIHLAAMPSPHHGTPEEVFTNNTRATFVVLEEAGAAGVRHAVIASSYSAYGFPWADRLLHPDHFPIDLATRPQVEDHYGLSKLVDELTADVMSRRHGMTVVALRFPFIGTDERLAKRAHQFVVDPAAGAAEVWGYLDTRDAAAASWHGLIHAPGGCNVVLVASPQTLAPYPTNDLLATYHPGVPIVAGLPGRTVAIDLEPAQRLLGFAAQHIWPVEERDLTTETEER